ncbi:MAG: hypothetical protein E7143_01455 [Rikenellaceae bacterium]|nr:hypothetical protein [Rikenellaceae bacterium]
MKKKLLYCLCCAALFAGCTTEPELIDVVAPQGAPQIKISGTINQTYTTRVDDGGFCDGDQIGLFGVNYSENNTVAGELLDSGNQVDNARYTFDEASWNWVSSGSIYYKDAETNIDLYGYYPYGSVNSVSEYAFEVAQDQSGNNTIDGYAQSDFLWGKAENVAPSEEKVKIKFNHRMACANVVLTQGEGFESGEFDALKKSVLVINTTRKAVVDLQSGEVVATGEAESEGIVMKHNEEGFRAIVVPQTVEAGKALFSITVNGITYRYKMSDTAVDYQSGKQTKFTITINKKSHSGEYEFSLVDCQIVDWVADLDSHGGEARQYFVVKQERAGVLGEKIRATKKNPNKIKNLKISGKINATDFRFMRDSMEILQAVNLKETEIVDEYGIYCQLYENGSWGNYYDEYFDYALEKRGDYKEAILARHPNATNVNIHSSNSAPTTSSKAHEIPDNAFRSKISLVHFCFPERITKIGYQAFYNTLLSGALIIPNDVTEIGNYAFYNTNITSLQLPHGLKSLGSYAFQNCSSLSGTLSLPESLESMGDNCFFYCQMLTGNLVLPSKLTEISRGCFNCCSSLTGDLVIPEGISVIHVDAFRECSGMKGSLSLPKGLKSLGACAFQQCSLQGELVIPSQIKSIESNCFYHCDFSSVVFAENSELIKIEENAFDGNWRLSEPVVLPEGLLTIEESAFIDCRNMPAVVLPKSLTVIGRSAFSKCYNLSAITSNATTPPICGSGAWDGVAKDNFAVEVPEQSVVKYQTQTGWSDFRRIAAHHDFSLSRPLLRVLNAEHSKTYVMRAPSGEAWSVESAPEWVTVSPSSGVGKMDVTVTVNEMAAADVGTFKGVTGGSVVHPEYTTYNGRAGEIVFLLNDKDYRIKMTVEQYDYQYGDGEVLVNQRATEGNGVNIVFMGDCFDARDIADGSYLKGVSEAIGHYFAIEPYKTYKPYFNIYTIFGLSPDSGVGTVNTIKEAKFGSQYSLEGITPDYATVYEYAMKSETVNETNLGQTLVVLVENTTDYGGICYMWGDGSAIACCPMSADAYPFDFRGIVQHEAGGHGFAKLADEYIYHNAFIQTCTCPCCNHLKEFREAKAMGWYRNLSENGDMKSVEWAHLIYHPDYSNIVDMYEGGYFHTRGIYRSEATSCMNNNIPYYSAISRQEMVERIMRYAGKEFSIEDFYARDVRDASNNGINTASAKLFVEDNAITWNGASKQMPPKYMGDKPQLKKSNK